MWIWHINFAFDSSLDFVYQIRIDFVCDISCVKFPMFCLGFRDPFSFGGSKYLGLPIANVCVWLFMRWTTHDFWSSCDRSRVLSRDYVIKMLFSFNPKYMLLRVHMIEYVFFFGVHAIKNVSFHEFTRWTTSSYGVQKRVYDSLNLNRASCAPQAFFLKKSLNLELFQEKCRIFDLAGVSGLAGNDSALPSTNPSQPTCV